MPTITYQTLYDHHEWSDEFLARTACLDAFLAEHLLTKEMPVDQTLLFAYIRDIYKKPDRKAHWQSYWTLLYIRIDLLSALQSHGLNVDSTYYGIFSPYEHNQTVEIAAHTILPSPPNIQLNITYENSVGSCDYLDKYFEEWTFALSDSFTNRQYNDEDIPENILNGIGRVEERPSYVGTESFYIFGFTEITQCEVGVCVVDKSPAIFKWDHEDYNMTTDYSFMDFIKALSPTEIYKENAAVAYLTTQG